MKRLIAKTKAKALAVVAAAFTLPVIANAQTSGGGGLDVSSLTSQISGANANISTVGLAILGALALVAVISLIRRVVR